MRKADPVVLMSKLVWAGRMVSYIFATYALLLAIVILVGGPRRFAGAGYLTAMEVPGAPPVWGWVLLPMAIASLYAIRTSSYTLAMWGMRAMGTWCMFFACSFAVSAYRFPEANLTAMLAYGKDAVVFLGISVAYKHRRMHWFDGAHR